MTLGDIFYKVHDPEIRSMKLFYDYSFFMESGGYLFSYIESKKEWACCFAGTMEDCSLLYLHPNLECEKISEEEMNKYIMLMELNK